MRAFLTNKAWFWTAFTLVHAFLFYLANWPQRKETLGDVDLYAHWVSMGFNDGVWPVFHTDWVYPLGALAPMALVGVTRPDTTTYGVLWCILIFLVNAAAAAILWRMKPRGFLAAWWWLAFLFLLGPVFMGRIEGIIAPVMIAGFALAMRRPRWAAAVFTIGAWIKIAPGVILIPLFLETKKRWRNVVLPAALTCVAFVTVAFIGGGGTRVLTFLGAQDTRGLQIESVMATPFHLARLFPGTGYSEFYNRPLNTIEIVGPGIAAFANTLNVLMALAIAAITLLLWFRRDIGLRAFLWGSVALIAALIVFNKVGSPQFQAWLGAPIAFAIAVAPDRNRWRWPAGITLAIAALTQWLYPLHYGAFVIGRPDMILLTSTRNLLVVALMVWAIVELVRMRPARIAADEAAEALEAAAEAAEAEAEATARAADHSGAPTSLTSGGTTSTAMADSR